MIRAFVFDIGNVLVDWHTIPFIKRLINCDDAVARKLDNAIFNSPAWKDTDRGTGSRDAVMKSAVSEYPEYEDEIRLLIGHADEVLLECKPNTEYLKTLKARGYGIYYLSNTNAPAFMHMQETCEFFKLMDGGIASFHHNVLKPSHRIFELFTSTYQFDPGECVFVDDTRENTDAAKEVGFKTITLHNMENLESEIDGLLNTENPGSEVDGLLNT